MTQISWLDSRDNTGSWEPGRGNCQNLITAGHMLPRCTSRPVVSQSNRFLAAYECVRYIRLSSDRSGCSVNLTLRCPCMWFGVYQEWSYPQFRPWNPKGVYQKQICHDRPLVADWPEDSTFPGCRLRRRYWSRLNWLNFWQVKRDPLDSSRFLIG